MKRLLTAILMLGLGVLSPAQTPELLKDINPGNGDGISYDVTFYLFRYFAEFNGKVYFAAEDGVHGVELWSTDGTTAGTAMVKDINEGPDGSACQKFYATEEYLFFVAYDEETGNELWRTDGTEAGTIRLKDIYPGPESSIYTDYGWPDECYAWNGVLYFSANDGLTDKELWRSDGTEAGTWMVKDINAGGSGSFPYYYFALHEDRLYFTANYQLWATDGTEAGTELVAGFVKPYAKASCNGYLLFIGNDGFSNRELWRSDGTEAGTVKVKEIDPVLSGIGGCYSADQEKLVVMGNAAYFPADDGVNGMELWRSDGTEAGTYMVYDAQTTSGGCAQSMVVWNDVLYYGESDDAHGSELWRTDGTEAGTWIVKDMVPGANGSFDYVVNEGNIVVAGNRLIFGAGKNTASNVELWQSDGTEAGTALLMEIEPGSWGSDPFGFMALGDGVIFAAENSQYGIELWQYNLTSSVKEPRTAGTGFTLAPSPAESGFSVLFPDDTHPGVFDVTLVDYTGATLKTWTGAASGKWLDTGGLPGGIYFVQVSAEQICLGARKIVLIK
jgi:ELWxxDGT repeat protein